MRDKTDQLESGARSTYDACVTTNAEKLLRDALTLPPADRAEMAAHLLASLDETEQDVDGVGRRDPTARGRCTPEPSR